MLDTRLARHFRNGVRVGLQTQIALSHIRQMRITEVLLCDRREQDNRRRPFTVVFIAQQASNHVRQLGLKFANAFGTGKRFVEPEENERGVRPCPLQPFVLAAKSFNSQARINGISGEAEIAKHQLLIGKPALKHGFHPAVMLHPFGQRISNHGNPQALSNVKLGRRRQVIFRRCERSCRNEKREQSKQRRTILHGNSVQVSGIDSWNVTACRLGSL